MDQIEIIENEFRIEKVYYIQGTEQAEALWAEEHGKKGAAWTASGLIFGYVEKLSDFGHNLPPVFI